MQLNQSFINDANFIFMEMIIKFIYCQARHLLSKIFLINIIKNNIYAYLEKPFILPRERENYSKKAGYYITILF